MRPQETDELFAGTTACHELAAKFLSSFDVPYEVIGGNHDLEGIDEFATDEANLNAMLRIHGKPTMQFKRQIAEKTLLVRHACVCAGVGAGVCACAGAGARVCARVCGRVCGRVGVCVAAASRCAAWPELKPCVTEAAAPCVPGTHPCVPGCHPMHPRLLTRASHAVTPRTPGGPGLDGLPHRQVHEPRGESVSTYASKSEPGGD